MNPKLEWIFSSLEMHSILYMHLPYFKHSLTQTTYHSALDVAGTQKSLNK